ncbi:hypothetical protein F2P56_007594 [Juglans regia]|uniref:Uncharacterized protein LOC108990903 n=2 Tax=Juglans regia TaxID=51240 RepID=A0A2I4EMD7_JUGRE|nr:uncharacterized protein LOC108990903 [Juglans regia]KAF5475828.1 hypothetical protein F2P56_007594 [Juglans regia]
MEKKLERGIPVIKEFLEVLDNDLPGLPLIQVIECTLDLELVLALEHKAQYRMTPSELKELKVQAQELLDKGLDKDLEDHMNHLQLVLGKLREHLLYARLSKCKFFLEEVKLLGHVISKDGVAVDPIKVEAVVD